jgi:hypothetical protein
MSRTTRTAAALGAVVALGLAAPAASAGPHQHAGSHGQSDHKPGKPGKPGKPATKLAHAQKKVAQQVLALDRRLARVPTALVGLTDQERSSFVAGVAADRASLVALQASAAAATSLADLAPVTRALAAVRPENYAVGAAAVRQVARLGLRVGDGATALAAITDRDVSEGLAANAAARAALASAEAHALALTASSTRVELRALHADFVTVHQSLETVDEVLAGA